MLGIHEARRPAGAVPVAASTGHSFGAASGRSASRARASHGSARVWSWLPGTSVTRLPAAASASCSNKAARLEQVRQRALAQLEEVAEHDPVGGRERGGQPLERARRRRVGAADRAEVQVGDDRGRHPRDGGSTATGLR